MIKCIKAIFNSIEVYAIYSLCMYMPTLDKFNKIANELIDSSKVKIYGFYSNDSLIGVIVITVNSDKTADINGIAVMDAFQHKGIGKKLIKYSLKDNSITMISTETDDDAVLFYTKCGFNIEEFYKVFDNKQIKRYKCTLYC